MVTTLFVYIRNVFYLVENVETKQGQFPWLEIRKQARIVAIPVMVSTHKMKSRKQSRKVAIPVIVSTHEMFNTTSLLNEQNVSLSVPNIIQNLTYKESYQNVTYKTIFRTQNKRYISHEKLFNKNKSKTVILFYNPCNFQLVRNITNVTYTFENCESKNCRVTFNQSDANVSDAVIFHWFKQLKSYPNFNRPRNQVWIFIQHEPTRSYARNSTDWPWYKVGMQKNFNWTMTYSRFSDIHLPYGKMKIKPERPYRDYLKIAKSKTKDAIWVVSKCPTAGRREEYVNILKKYIDVEILGACGRNWTCGVRSNHDLGNCFSVLNKTYRYYLAFENDLCDDYVSEKFYENYKYDLLLVSRAGHPLKRQVNIDKEAYINAKDFNDAHELGIYLSKLSKNVSQYAKMLAKKDRYEVVNYQELFKESMCSICKRLNNLKKYNYVYKDVYEWMRKREPCYKATDFISSN